MNNKRIKFLIILTILLMLILIINLFKVQVINNKYYKNKVQELSSIIYYGDSTPRGRIYDRNGILLVDNEVIKTIYYIKDNNDTYLDEINKSYKIAENFDIDFTYLNINDLKRFYYLQNMDIVNKRITKEEINKLNNRELEYEDIYKLKLDRITDKEINSYNELDKEAAYIYYLINNGYYYSKKVIKKNISDFEFAKAGELINEIKGLDVKLDWNRKYLYDNTLRSILGNVSSSEVGIPYELKDYYLNLGYSLNDRVGLSGIEYQYEDILKGVKDKYITQNNKTNIIYGKRGNDIYLTIDINLQLKVDEIIKNILCESKKYKNTKYYDRSYVVITDPNNGDILAISGKKILNDEIIDCTYDIITYPITVGSVIKGASQIVGYNNNVLKIGEVRYDTCLKFNDNLKKCSYSNLGYINDLEALEKSSNIYQYLTAIKIGGSTYKYNGYLNINNLGFSIYRNTFKEFGLGTYTGIDLPFEETGYIGSDIGVHLLDLAVGQYDNYTTLQLSQYINTIATKKRTQLHLLKKINNNDYQYKIYNELNTEDKYINRVREGFRRVITKGTGKSYVNQKYSFAGKTGTSESFKDTNNDGIIDTPTITNTFAVYYPYEDPKVSFVIISPNVSSGGYIAPINKMLSMRITNAYLENNSCTN